jgi:hypothetical protein
MRVFSLVSNGRRRIACGLPTAVDWDTEFRNRDRLLLLPLVALILTTNRSVATKAPLTLPFLTRTVTTAQRRWLPSHAHVALRPSRRGLFLYLSVGTYPRIGKYHGYVPTDSRRPGSGPAISDIPLRVPLGSR